MTEKKESAEFRCGMVSIVGRPNVGKSTLVNKILGEKVAIVSKVPQTTRNQVRGIYNDEQGQIIFIDTPGLHVSRDKLDKFMNNAAYGMIHDVDCVIHLVDAKDSVGKEEEDIVKRLVNLNVPVVLGLNKVDRSPKNIDEYIALWERVKGCPVTEIKNFTMISLSGKNGTNIDKLIEIVYGHLPVSPALYDRDIICDVPERMVMSDIIREKLLNVLHDEVPHSVAVVIEDVQPRKRDTLVINAAVIVERETQKMIVIGKNGANLKKIGTLARKEIEALVEKKVFLEIFVKNKKNWRDDSSILEEMGYAGL